MLHAETHGVFTEAETVARKDILLEQYLGTVDMEVHCMVNMIKTAVIPSCKAAAVDFATATAGVTTLQSAWAAIEEMDDLYAQCAAARTLRLETMVAPRADFDSLEGDVPEADWSLASYRELLFLDSHPF